MSAETRDGRKPVSIRLGEEELALLPKADTLAEAVRLAIVTAADARALKKALGGQLDVIETRLERMAEASDDRAARVEAQLAALVGRLPPAPDDPFIGPAERALMVLAEMLKVNLRLVAEVHALSDGLLEAAKDAALTDAQIDAHVRARIERHRTATLAPADAIVKELHAALAACQRRRQSRPVGRRKIQPARARAMRPPACRGPHRFRSFSKGQSGRLRERLWARR